VQQRAHAHDVDQERAAGVLIEFERGRPITVDRPLYRELVKSAIKRTHGCRRYSRVARNAGLARLLLTGESDGVAAVVGRPITPAQRSLKLEEQP
jgi:hypothetical protein